MYEQCGGRLRETSSVRAVEDNLLSTLYTFIGKIQKLGLENYAHDSVFRLLFRKNEVTLIVEFFSERAYAIDIRLVGSHIELVWEKARHFCDDVSKITEANGLHGSPLEIWSASATSVGLFVARTGEIFHVGTKHTDKELEYYVGIVGNMVDELEQIGRLLNSV